MNKRKTSLYPSLYRLCSLSGIEGNIRDQAPGPTLKLQQENRLLIQKFDEIPASKEFFGTLKI